MEANRRNYSNRTGKWGNMLDPYARLCCGVLHQAVQEYHALTETMMRDDEDAEDREEVERKIEMIRQELLYERNPFMEYSGLDGKIIVAALDKRKPPTDKASAGGSSPLG